MAPSCASSVPPLIGDYPRCRAAAWQAAPTLPLGLSVAAASLGTEASLPLDMPGGREGLEGDTDAPGERAPPKVAFCLITFSVRDL